MGDSKLKPEKSDTCDLCQSAARYTCPGCERRTCSLQCVKQHKEDTGCDGQRNKIRYKPMSEMDDLDILNDFRFLEEMERQIEGVAREGGSRGGRRRGRGRGGGGGPGAAETPPPQLQPAQYRLRRAARRRGVRLDFLPQPFQRSRENTSQPEPGTGALLWRVEWRFPLADLVRTDERLSDTTRLTIALERHLSVGEGTENDPLQFYRAAFELCNIRVFLQAERVQQGNRYIELNVHKTLQSCLQDRLVIEFPILIVTTEEHAHVYREDRIEESFFSLCKQEEEERRRQRRAERRRGADPAAAAERDEPERKVPRPRLDAVPVVAPPPPPPPPTPENGTQQQQQPSDGAPQDAPSGEDAQKLESQEEKKEAEEEEGKTEKVAAAGFGLFGADDSDLSD